MQKRRAFTLIELLVVIGILALLIAILLPSLSKAQKAARTAVCATRERGLAFDLAQYLEEFQTLNGITSYAGDRWYNLLPAGNSGYQPNMSTPGAFRVSELITCPEATRARVPTPDYYVNPTAFGNYDDAGKCDVQWLNRAAVGAGAWQFSGSYSINSYAVISNSNRLYHQPMLKKRQEIPVFADSTSWWLQASEFDTAPTNLYDPAPDIINLGSSGTIGS
jgi:prepilin-type N-terminal cleavage/methylation domain-containing protein